MYLQRLAMQISSRSLFFLFHRLCGLRRRGASASAALAAGSAAASVSARRQSAAPSGSARHAACRLSGGWRLLASPPADSARRIESILSLPPAEAPVSRNDKVTTENTPPHRKQATRITHNGEPVTGVLYTGKATSPNTQTLVHVHMCTLSSNSPQQINQIVCMQFEMFYNLNNKNS